ncbi:iron donor protein CyaY [Endomicrobium sp. AH-315-J14]|nr:iron donor protein CyaY [Endomicrobium sp. AH-315-J14]
MALSESEFEHVADEELQHLMEVLIDCNDGIEADLESGVLTLEFEDDDKFVINSHRAAGQIWMAAMRTAWHFDYQDDSKTWVASQSGDELWSALDVVLKKKLGESFKLDR